MHLEPWQAVVLGLVEGITEYLPISSTGHLILAQRFLGLDEPAEKQAVDDFLVIIQGGAILAVLGLYWPRVVQMLRGLIGKDPAGFHLVVCLLIAFMPAAVLGLLIDKWVERHLFFAGPVMLAMLVGGVYMILIDQWRAGRFGLRPLDSTPKDVTDMTWGQALRVGLLQCVALCPGTSRSMMTITGGLLGGLRGKQAAEFSFLLGLPTLLAACLYKLGKNLWHAHKEHTPNVFERLGVTPAVIGIGVATVSAAVAVKWLVGFLSKHGLSAFGWYRIALFAVLAVLVWRGVVRIEPKEPHAGVRSTEQVPPLKFDAGAK